MSEQHTTPLYLNNEFVLQLRQKNLQNTETKRGCPSLLLKVNNNFVNTFVNSKAIQKYKQTPSQQRQ
jgi:hypothetical protein